MLFLKSRALGCETTRDDGALRVRISSTRDVRVGALRERVVTSAADVMVVVREWLDWVPR